METEKQKPEAQDKPQDMQDGKKRMPEEENERPNTVGKVPEPQLEEEENKGNQP